VRAVLLVGSRARTDTPADVWSDVDLALVVDEPDRYLREERWVEAFGKPVLTFLEPTAVGRAFERRVLYEEDWTWTSPSSPPPGWKPPSRIPRRRA
jgi:aminoglycoside 6-adenylyltransferase